MCRNAQEVKVVVLSSKSGLDFGNPFGVGASGETLLPI